MGRPSKLTPEVQDALVRELSLGVTVEMACAQIGISDRIFYDWLAQGKEAQSGKFFQFSQAVTHAREQANRHAVGAFRTGMTKTESVSDSTETFTETRLRTVKRPDGTIEQVPYDHKKTVHKSMVTQHPPDWRAGEAWLKRRDSKNWSATTRLDINLSPETLQKLKQIEELATQHGHDVGEIFNAIIAQYANADSE